MKPLVALYKLFRGGEWLDASLASIADHVEGVVAVIADRSWNNNGLPNNCYDVLKDWDMRRPGWIKLAVCEANRQEDQYRHGLAIIREEFGNQCGVLLIDSDEVWESHCLNKLRNVVSNDMMMRKFCSTIRTYLRSPLYQVWPIEKGLPAVALKSPEIAAVKGRFGNVMPDRDLRDVYFHHFPYVRRDESEIQTKFFATSSQEHAQSNPEWLTTVWPNLPYGTNLHMTPGFAWCWQEIKILPRPPIKLPDWCQDTIRREEKRWQSLLEAQVPAKAFMPTATPHDAEKYPEFGSIAKDVTLLRRRLKMTYLEALVLYETAKRFPDGRILEIGSGSGGSMTMMALTAGSKAELWAIDPFAPYTETGITTVRGVMEGNENEFWDTARHYGYADRVRHVKENSQDAAEQCPDEFFDLVFIDGNHTYENVKLDLDLYWPKVKSGGILVGHDFTTRFPGVIRAVKEFGVPYSIFAGTSLFYMEKTP